MSYQTLQDRIDILEGIQAAMQAVMGLALQRATLDDLQALAATQERLSAELLGSHASDRKLQAFEEAMTLYRSCSAVALLQPKKPF